MDERIAEAYQHFGYFIFGTVDDCELGSTIPFGTVIDSVRSQEIVNAIAAHPWRVMANASLSEATKFGAFLGKKVMSHSPFSNLQINYYKIEVLD